MNCRKFLNTKINRFCSTSADAISILLSSTIPFLFLAQFYLLFASSLDINENFCPYYLVWNRGGVESNRTNFELIFLEFFELKMYFRINRIENFSNRTNRIILPSNRIEFRIFSLVIFRIFSNSFEFFSNFFQHFF